MEGIVESGLTLVWNVARKRGDVKWRMAYDRAAWKIVMRTVDVLMKA